jgi:DNA-binding MarR family transcriptional regulator
MNVDMKCMRRERLREVGEWLIDLARSEDTSAVPILEDILPPFEDLRSNRKLVDYEPLFSRVAKAQYLERDRRSRYFDADLFGEPAWDILLDLYTSRIAGRRLSITSLCHGTRVPSTTALRWVGVLEQRGLIRREASTKDKRVFWVHLTDVGMASMSDYFAEIVAARRQVGA